MHRPAHPRSLPAWWAAAGLLALTACGFGGGGKGDPQAAAVARNRIQWGTERPERYRYTLTEACACAEDITRPRTFTVDGDEVVEAEPADLDPARQVTIDSLFDLVVAELADGHKVIVRYDADYGFPVTIDIDPDPSVADDETEYRISDFEALD